jgi:hypothetical protein
VACDGLEFYRITERALHAFEASKQVPPPHLRGSATASHFARIDLSEPLNLIALGEGRVLVIGKQNVFRYQRGEKQARPVARIPTPASLFVWPDERQADAFWVRVLGEQQAHHYTLPSSTDSNPTPRLAEHTEPLAAGSRGLPAPSGSATLTFPDGSPNRYWTADPSGNLGLRNRDRPEPPVFTARVPGVVIDSAVQDDHVAVLSMRLEGDSYRPTVTVFSERRERSRFDLGPSIASLGQPELDLCLLAARPWLVVGGRQWLLLFDWSDPRLLAQW